MVRALPPEAALWAVLDEAEKRANTPTVEQIRARAAYYTARREMSKTQVLEHDMSIEGHAPDCPICKQAEEAE